MRAKTKVVPIDAPREPRKFLPREFGLGDFLDWQNGYELRRALRRLEREDRVQHGHCPPIEIPDEE
jgi:hypothetical protein